jgi:hypothetical protein
LDTAQGDIFASAAALYPVAAPAGVITAEDFNRRFSQGVSEALRLCGLSRARVAFEMSELLGDEVTEHMLNAYASPARPEHTIPIARLRALVKVTGALWLLDTALEGLGVTLLAGQDALYAQAGLIDRQIAALTEEKKRLKGLTPATPATLAIKRRGA